MNVQLIAYTPNPEQVVASSAKLCYSKVGVSEIMEKQTQEQAEKFVKKLESMGHESPLGHINFTFAIEGISRACSLQLVRHKIGCQYSQQSQRYVNLENTFEYITPELISEHSDIEEEFHDLMNRIHEAYKTMNRKLIDKGIDKKVAIENTRAILPNATETKIVVTMSAIALLNFFKQRCCMRAQDEIREMAYKMLSLVYEVAPSIFNKAGAECVYGHCPEGSMSCGKSPYVFGLTMDAIMPNEAF